MIADLYELERILTTPPQEALKMLDQLAFVKNPETKAKLNESLSSSLSDTNARVGISWPHERIDQNGTPDSWKLKGLNVGRGGRTTQGIPEWEDILELLRKIPEEQRLSAIEKSKIQLFRDAHCEDPISQETPLMKWISFETDLDDLTYCLYDGNWYQIHHDYTKVINHQVKELFDRSSSSLNFPSWNIDENEAAYNIKLAAHLNGTCLDRDLIRTELHPRGIEACDVYLPDGTFIHVKKTDSSDRASHLLAQALVSADSICNDDQARSKLREKIANKGGDITNVTSKPTRVVLAMHRTKKKSVSAEELFTFTKVNLIRQVNSLESRSIKVEIVAIFE